MDYVALLKKAQVSESQRIALTADLEKFFTDERSKQAELQDAIAKQTEVCKGELQIWQGQAEFYKNAYQGCVNAGKRSGGCTFLKIITIGLARCH